MNVVPELARAGLKARFDLLKECESQQHWSEIYDLLFGPFVADKSKEEYIQQRRMGSRMDGSNWLVNFHAEQITNIDDSEYAGANYKIEGTAKVRERCVVQRHGVVYAQLRDGEWYFSGFIVDLAPLPSPADPCIEETDRQMSQGKD